MAIYRLGPILGILNTLKYRYLYEQMLETELKKVADKYQGIFQQHYAPCDVSKAMIKYFKDRNISFLN